jgi:hypothetical protein
MSEHALQIIVGTTQRHFKAEMVLDDESDWPPSIEGKLLDATVEEMVTLKFGSEKVTVTFRGKRYKFDLLEKDGTFVLVADFRS